MWQVEMLSQRCKLKVKSKLKLENINFVEYISNLLFWQTLTNQSHDTSDCFIKKLFVLHLMFTSLYFSALENLERSSQREEIRKTASGALWVINEHHWRSCVSPHAD